MHLLLDVVRRDSLKVLIYFTTIDAKCENNPIRFTRTYRKTKNHWRATEVFIFETELVFIPKQLPPTKTTKRIIDEPTTTCCTGILHSIAAEPYIFSTPFNANAFGVRNTRSSEHVRRWSGIKLHACHFNDKYYRANKSVPTSPGNVYLHTTRSREFPRSFTFTGTDAIWIQYCFTLALNFTEFHTPRSRPARPLQFSTFK